MLTHPSDNSGPAMPPEARDHGSLVAGACDAKSEIPDPADQARRLVVEWTADL
jgi:hypothetical protein